MRAHLSGRGVQPEVADQAVAELVEQGYLDDVRFAHRFAEDRRTLDHWGSERIERRLSRAGHRTGARRRGRRAAGTRASSTRRWRCSRGASPRRRAIERDLNRALGLLVRRGYELELAHDAIQAYRRA